MSESIIDLFETQSSLNSGQRAVVTEDGLSILYEELDALASVVQTLVYQQIIRNAPNSSQPFQTPLVSVMIDRNISFITAILGILKAGAAYVPVDPAFPPDRQLYIFNHSKCELLIIDEVCYKQALELNLELPPYILMDPNGNVLSMKLPSPMNESSHSKFSSGSDDIRKYRSTHRQERLAYVLYTSGSTGKPKGVMVKHVGVHNIVRWFADILKVGSSSRVFGLTTFCFDISVLEVFLPLTRGGTLILAKSSTQKDPFRIVEIMREHAVSVFQATPTTYEMMLATGIHTHILVYLSIVSTISFIYVI